MNLQYLKNLFFIISFSFCTYLGANSASSDQSIQKIVIPPYPLQCFGLGNMTAIVLTDGSIYASYEDKIFEEWKRSDSLHIQDNGNSALVTRLCNPNGKVDQVLMQQLRPPLQSNDLTLTTMSFVKDSMMQYKICTLEGMNYQVLFRTSDTHHWQQGDRLFLQYGYWYTSHRKGPNVAYAYWLVNLDKQESALVFPQRVLKRQNTAMTLDDGCILMTYDFGNKTQTFKIIPELAPNYYNLNEKSKIDNVFLSKPLNPSFDYRIQFDPFIQSWGISAFDVFHLN